MFSASCPLVIRIEQVPEGAPDGRIVELIAMLSSQNVRVTVEFRCLAGVSQFGVRLEAAAIDGAIPLNLDDMTAAAIAESSFIARPNRRYLPLSIISTLPNELLWRTAVIFGLEEASHWAPDIIPVWRGSPFFHSLSLTAVNICGGLFHPTTPSPSVTPA